MGAKKWYKGFDNWVKFSQIIAAVVTIGGIPFVGTQMFFCEAAE